MRRVLDRVTGVVTMYKLVLVCLLAIAAVAVVLSLLGQLSRTPLELLVSLVVAVGSTMLTGWLAALVARRRAHVESSIITGLLIFMVMEPTTDPLALGGIALAGTIATASKYLIAVRGRHILNPAAAGTIVVGAVGLAFPVWWIGTPYLQPVIIIGALLVLYRTATTRDGRDLCCGGRCRQRRRIPAGRQHTRVGSRLCVPVVGALLLRRIHAERTAHAPPRRWQQLTVAVVAALVFAVPFNSGYLNKYLLALLVANLVAFGFGQRRGIRLQLSRQQTDRARQRRARLPAVASCAFRARPVHGTHRPAPKGRLQGHPSLLQHLVRSRR